MEVNIVDIFSIISSVFSIVLGILAISLSIVFYKMSEKSSKDAEKSANQIDSNIKKLETLFDKLYSGTFDMMRETVSDMRKHVYSNNHSSEINSDVAHEIETKTNQVISNVVREIKSNQKTDEEIEKLILQVITRTKQLEEEVVTGVLREFILRYLKTNGTSTYEDIMNHLLSLELITMKDSTLFREIEALADEGLINDPFEMDEVMGKSVAMKAKITLK